MATGSPVFIPPGTYNIDEVNVPANSIIFGMGDSSIIKRRTPSIAQICVFNLTGGNISMHSFKIDGNGSTGEWNAGLILCYGVYSNMRFENITFEAGAAWAFKLAGVSQIIIRGCRVVNTTSGGFWITSEGLAVDISDVFISDNYIDRSMITADSSSNHGILARGSDNGVKKLQRCVISNNIIKQHISGGICIEAWASSTSISGNTTEGGYMGISTANCEDISVSGNTIKKPVYTGIELTVSGHQAICSGNIVEGDGFTGAGIIQSAPGQGCDETNIVGNTITGVNEEGIFLSGTIRSNVSGNYVRLNPASPTSLGIGIRFQAIGRGAALASITVSGNYLCGMQTGNTSAINLENHTSSGDPNVSLAITGNTMINWIYGVILYASGIVIRGTVVGNDIDNINQTLGLFADAGGTHELARTGNRGDIPTITGAKSGNAALTSLITALATQGLIVNSTT